MVETTQKSSATTDGEGLSKTVSNFLAETYRIRMLLGTMFALVVADGVISNFLIAQGLGREWNPFLQIIVLHQIFLPLKLAGALLAVLMLWYVYRRRPHVTEVFTLCVVILYTAIVYWNLFVFVIVQPKTLLLTISMVI